MRYVVVIVALLAMNVPAGADRPGVAFLRLTPDARGGALLGGTSVLASDATAVRHNPALLGRLEGMNLALSHHQWVQDIRQEFAAVGLGGGAHHVGMGFGYVDYGSLEYRETASSEPLGTFRPSDLEIAVCYALRLRSDLSVGVSGKFLQEKILSAEATGYGADIGVWKSWEGLGIETAGVVQHVGSMDALHDESASLPLTYRMAVAWHGPFAAAGLTVGGHAFSTPGVGSGVSVFTEYAYRRAFLIRGGLGAGELPSNWALGAGVNLGPGSLDYAYLPVGNELGSSHRVSLSLWP